MQHMAGLRGSRLSIQQAHLWALQQDTQIYWVQCALSLEGPLHSNMLRLAFEDVIRQHEILRTYFHRLPGMEVPIQVVSSEIEIAWEEYDLQYADLTVQQASVEATLANVREKAHDLSSGPITHVTLLKYARSQALLLLSLPALCADIPTLERLIAALAQAYTVRLQHKASAIDDETLQYADVSAWQNEVLEEEDARLRQAFWTQKDLSHLDSFHLPFSKTALSDQMTLRTFTPQKLTIDSFHTLPSSLLEEIGVSPKAFFLACWQILLWRLTGEEGIAVGVACDGRNYEELTNALGPYTRFIPLITDFSEDASFKQVLTQVQSALDLAHEAQLYFSWDILPTSRDRRPAGKFFPLSFEFEQWPTAVVAEHLHFTLQESFGCTERFMLKLVVQQVGETLQGELHYDAAYMQPEQIRGVAHALLALLRTAPTQLQTPVSHLPILENTEQERLLRAFRGPERRYTAQTLQQLFEEQAAKTPGNVAVICGDQQLTYEQLHVRANRLAHWLKQHGVGPDVLVCLYLDRNLDGLVGLLAVLKAGGAYVPLDPDAPQARLAFQLEDTQAPVLLTQEHLLPRLPAFAGLVFCLDRDIELLSHEATTNPASSTHADNLAYVIYTSGSTGVPKGVLIRQGSVVNYTCDMRQRIAPESGLHFATVSTLAADLGNTSIFSSLASGGCLHILSYETLTSGETFASYLEQHPIDVLKIVPSHFQALLASCNDQDIFPRKYLVLGGETLSRSLLRAIWLRGARCAVINHYGPTETTIGALVNELGVLQETSNPEVTDNEMSPLPIGCPIANVQVCVVDRYQQIVPVGVTGELLISGVGLAAGYLHQTELTQARFLPHPLLKDSAVKVYKTGDLARYTPNGLIEFVGRADRQVKLRGYRIELGEIEATLRRHPDVHEAAAMLREDIPGDKRLVAYVVSDQQASLAHGELRSFLQQTLPEYMIPTLIIQLSTLPLTSNGKLNYQALPIPEQSADNTHVPYTAPRNPIENILVSIWQDVLQSSPIGIYDDFFAIGGHSLLVTQVISRIKAILQVNLPIVSIFDAPTVARLAELVESALHDHHPQNMPPLTAVSHAQDLPLSFAQQRLWFLYQLDPDSSAYNVPFALRIKGKLSIEALEYNLGEVVRRHEILRTTFIMKNERPLQYIHPWHEYHLKQQELHTIPPQQRENEVWRLIQEEAQHPFDLTQGPLLRTSLLCLDEDDYVLLLTMHHIVSDGWSTGILLRELRAFYMAHVKKEPGLLEDLPVQYADYAHWQNRWLQGEVLDAQLHYWTRQLAGIVPTDLPTDYPRPAVQSFRGAELNYQLSRELLEGLKHLSQSEGTTLFMTLLASFQILLARYSGQDDIAIGTPSANRHYAGIEGLIGPFINTLVLRTSLAGNPTFHELLQRVRKVSLEAYAHQDFPFEKLVEALQPQRDLSRTPLFQVMFGLQNMPLPDVDLDSLSLTPYQGTNTTSKFDLTLTTMEREQGLLCIVEYSTDLFKMETIERMMQGWQSLLQTLIDDPQRHIAELPVMGPGEQTVLQQYSTGPQLAVPQAASMHQRFEEQVLRTPEAIALSCGDHQLTYQQLNQRANRLAHHLQSQGVGPETLVALLAERDIHFLVALLAVLKAGGAFLPLDPLHPVGRLRHVLKNSACKFLLTTQSFTTTANHIMAESSAGLTIQISYIEDLLAQTQSEENLSVSIAPHHLSYIIYTSGSTGIPKGAMIEHAGMLNHLYAKITDLQMSSQDNVAQTASQCFDISVWQFLAALLVGGRVTIFPDSIAHDPTQMLLELERRSSSIYELVPSVLNFLLDVLEKNEYSDQHLSHLRYLLATGETLPPMLCRRWFMLKPNIPIVNAYGPTECSDDVTHYIISQPPEETTTTTSIGRPLANMQVYILDRTLHPVPMNTYGEIYVGGIGVGRGYFGDPQRTAETFLPNPFSEHSGARLYKTGDRARYLSNGTIEFVGRMDYQVKIRGFRIELGEIEAQLQQYPDVQDVVVIACEDITEDKFLVAYVLASMTISSVDLHDFLKEKLPGYMIPAAFILLDRLPLTPNGKVDRQALPVPEVKGAAVSYLAPRTPIEEILANLWGQTLGIELVSITDNFFERGGHSLLATRVIARIRELFQIELPLRTLFEAPTIAELAQHIEALQQSNTSQMLPVLKPSKYPDPIPLSFSQQRLWLLDQLEPGTSAYNIPAALHLSGPLSFQAFASSMQQIVQRHESLRTTFVSRQGVPTQVIAPFSYVLVPLLDLQGLPSDVQEEQVQLLARLEAQRPFDLSRGPLLRVYLLRLDEKKHVLLLNMHHIISDGWSIDVLGGELTKTYQAAVKGETAALPELPIQYADYALWQRNWLQGDLLQEQLDYWLQQLADAPDTLNFPLDRPRPAVQTYTGARQTIILPLTLRRELELLSQREGATLFMTLLASFQVLLMRYSRQSDIVVGTSVANRRQKDLEGLIGFFVNTLTMRIDLSQNPNFRQVLAQVREVALQAYAHQDLPFEQLVAQLPVERNLSHHPLFQVAFEFQHAPFSTLELPGVSWTPLTLARANAKFDLELTVSEEERGLRCMLVYNTDLFDASTIQRFLEHFQIMLEGIIGAPEQRISNLPLLSQPEKEQLLIHCNQTQRDFPAPYHYSQLFAQQVARMPERIAVCDQDEHLTYAALWQRVQQLASELQRMGVRPGTLVGIYLERSNNFLVSVLAIWQCAGAYVPLDPAYPQERLQFIIDQAQISLVITDTAHQRTLPMSSTRALCLEHLLKREPVVDKQTVQVPLLPQQLAYVIYTSGSTGVPKGVMVTHEGMLNHLWSKVTILELGEDDVVAQTASASFDISVWQLLAGLLGAGQVQILPDTISHDPHQLLQAVQEKAISVLQVVPSLLRYMLDEQDSPRYLQTGLRWMIVTGEAMPIDLCQRWWREQGAIRLLNAYGPTECSDDVTHALLNEQEGKERYWRIPIGFPIANTRLYVLDSYLQPVPTGVPGELYIGGVSLARGYLHRPEITASRFLPDPFHEQAGARLYKTGDLVRYLPDGSLEYLGRLDQQVKLRGYRIELEEIQTVLHQHPDVQHAVVIVREDTPDNKRLTAYYVGRESVTISPTELREHISKQLPDYMIPSVFFQMESLPLTPNGKLDLKALPVPDPDRTAANTIEIPHTPIEKALAAIMIEMLGIEQIGIADNFFESGGHSLLATRIIAQVRETFQVELPLRTFFEAPTIAALSQHIETLLKSGSSPLLPALLPAERPQQIPLSFAQQRLWFLQQLEPESSAYNIPAALRLSGSISIEAFTSSIQQVVQRHESLRTTFVFQQNDPVQMITPNAVVQLPLLDLQGLPPDTQEEQILLLALQEAQRPFDLATGPLMRVRLLRLEEEKHVLLFNMHHIISDGWSAGILIDELTTFYHATVRGEEASLPALPIQYADYALWQREWLQGKRLHEQIDYWQRQLDDVPATLNFPTDRPHPAIQTYVGNQQEMMLPIALSHELEALGQREGATLFMTLLASFQILLQRYSGQHDIVVGTSVANRRQKDLEGLIGCFINTLPLRTDLSGDPSFRELLVRVRDVALHAYAHQDLPFEQLVAQLPVERDLSQQPLFQVAFEFQNFPFTTLDIAGVSWSPLEFARTTSKFDLELTLALHEQGLRCVLEYNTDLFEASTIQRFLNHFQTLLEGIVRAPEQRISNLPLLSTSEREQLLIHGNQTQQELPSHSHYTLLLADQVARTPDRIAACDQQQQLTYAGLWQRAQRLASLLQRQGVGPETLVGLYLERSCSLLVSVLAIWQCGAAYVPLDPAYPRERLRLILEQSQVPLLLTTNALQANIPTEDTRLMCLEDLLTQELAENPPLASVPLLPQYLAYVIYTSGSTGTPKGVMISHEGMLNHLWAKIETLGIGETDVVAQTASQCFDISVWQLLASLLQGGQVQIFPDAISHDSSYLLRAAQQGAVSILQLVPSQLRLILDDLALHPAFQWNVRWLIVTGEAMPLSLCQRWWHQQGAIRLLNAYGPTECSDDVTHALLEEETTLTRVPIGSPIANTRIYVLDEHLEPVPQGVIGEIYVGGCGVGRGYLRDAKRTADVFVPDPYGIEPGGRLYRTGDRGRYREDGQLEFVERQDEQVKLRGYRIELGEIEAMLGQHPQVKQCVVLLQETKMQEKQIVAYVVIQEEEKVTLNRQAMLRNYLKEKLPPYMIPAHFLLLDALPLTANGKVNRKNLLALSWKQEELQEGKEIKLLLSPIEELVLQCWRQVLQREQLEIHEDFFEAGGHSLLATQVVAHLQQTMGIEIPLRTLFEAPTVAEFAAWLTQQLRQGQRLSAPAIVPGPRNHDLPLSFAQQRLWFQDQLEPGNTAYSIPTAVRLRGRLDRAALEQALARVIGRHEILRTTFPTCEGQPVLQIAAEPTTRQILVDLSYLTQEERESVAQHLALQEAEQPFDLARGPLLRFWLLSLSQEDHIVLLTMHHIISDGWSINILVNELTNLYTALEQGEDASLPELPVQYADYALWQRSWLQGEVLQQQLDYWKQQLANIVTLALPTDYPRPPIQTFQAAQQRLFLSDELSQKVRELSQREGVTLFMTMLAAFNVLLHYYTGQDDLVIGTNVANRNRAETEGLIGFFVNQLVLRTHLSGNPDFREILHRVKETALGAYVHQDLPFDRLLMELNPERDLSRTPLFQVKFALEHVPTQETALPNIRVESVKFEQETTKFDIFLNLFESNGKLFGTLEYRTDLFRLETIVRFLHLFEVVTTQVIAFPDMPLREIIAVITELDAENRSGQEKERRQRNVQKLGQVRRRAKQQVEPQ